MRRTDQAPDPADQRLRDAEDRLHAARKSACPWLMSSALADLARCCAAVGANAACENFLSGALDWARLTGSTDQVVDLLCELSETAESMAAAQEADRAGSSTEARQRAHQHATEAAQLAGQVSDPTWEVKVLLRISAVLDGMGDHGEALALQCRAMTLMAPDAMPLPLPDGPTAWSEFSKLPEI